jgi:hypothetical protein
MSGNGQVALHVNSSAVSRLKPCCREDVGWLLAAAPHHGPGQDCRAVGEHHFVREDILDPDTEMEDDTIAFQSFRGIGVGLVGERCQKDLSMID